ncbi:MULTISPECIES: hypothetical protein [Bacillus cereus group]|nr:hypothetical protein [Bacillus cereus]BCC09523.1 hypothetical protein BCM0060_p2189 [Bacillus cereus]BCC50581.1 hypothetical protein BCJMU02_p2175 [Bacillus cereus]
MELVKNSPYYVKYCLNGDKKYEPINETNFYDASERALEILKNEKNLKLKRDVRIKLVDNRKGIKYSSEWK